MMNNPALTPTSEQFSPSPALLYGNGGFLVRLWSILPGQRVPYAFLKTGQRSQFLLIEGVLQALGLPSTINFQRGQHGALEHPASSTEGWTFQNPANETATLLELLQGTDLPVIPLPEVTETRPWGSFTVLKDDPHYKLKQLLNTPGNRLSLQRHQQREEHWLVIAGQPEITLDDATLNLQAGDYIHIPLHSWHRLANPGENNAPVELIELQLGQYFGEDDIERRQDDYGRT